MSITQVKIKDKDSKRGGPCVLNGCKLQDSESLIRRINSLTMNVPNNVVVSLQMPAISLHLLQKQLKI